MPEFVCAAQKLARGWWIMSGTSSPEAVKKLLENMQSDLRALSLECKKKFPPVKEVSSGRPREEARCAASIPFRLSPSAPSSRPV